MEEVTRRGFLAVAGTGAVLGAAFNKGGDGEPPDGRAADAAPPDAVARNTRIVPPGGGGHRNFLTRCVGCQLCVNVCPNNVLRPSANPLNCFQPEMGFENGYCRPECVRCSEVCPAGAIRRITPAEKKAIHVGRALWHPSRCIAMAEDVNCSVCEENCPVQAIVRVPKDEGNPHSVKMPVVDKTLCIGCGACEHLCPARAMTVEGLVQHRVVKPMSEADVLDEATRLVRSGRAGVVLVKDGVISLVEPVGPGVKPILGIHDDYPDDLKGSCVVGNAVGCAAAAIAIDGGAVRVHGLQMSAAAKSLLERHGVSATVAEPVAQMPGSTRRGGGFPLEDAVKDLDSPAEMMRVIQPLDRAIDLIHDGRAGVVLVKNGVIVLAKPNGPGVEPILDIHDYDSDDLKGAWVIDKVVGRAAAAIALDGGAIRVHGLLMSEEAKKFLEKNGVPASAEEMVPQILNRRRDGLCPLEDSVKKLGKPEAMVQAIRTRIEKLKSK